MEAHPLISADPQVMTGMPCIRGTRITVANVVRQLAAGRTAEDLCRDYPDLTHASVRAALAFAADLAAVESYVLQAS